jgi:hypothetical protein
MLRLLPEHNRQQNGLSANEYFYVRRWKGGIDKQKLQELEHANRGWLAVRNFFISSAWLAAFASPTFLFLLAPFPNPLSHKTPFQSRDMYIGLSTTSFQNVRGHYYLPSFCQPDISPNSTFVQFYFLP